MKYVILTALIILGYQHYNAPKHSTDLYKTSVADGNLIATFTSNLDNFDLSSSNCSAFVEAMEKHYPNERFYCVSQ